MPRDTLTRERIVAAAIELMDAEGLEGMNMRALGGRLGAAATAVYWHVGGKDTLLALAADRVWGEIPLPDATGADWRAAATGLACGLRTMLTRHPWLVQAMGSHTLYGHNKARYDDRTLAVYEAAGFPGPQADQAAGAVFTFVLGNTMGPSARAALSRRLGRDDRKADARLRDDTADFRAIAERFPRLRARLGTPATGHGAAPERTFEVGLEALLDGLEARLES